MNDTKELAGAQRAAVFLLSLEREAAASVLRHLRDDVLGDVAEAMTSLDPSVASADRVQSLYRDLVEAAAGPAPVQPARGDELGRLLAASLGEERGASVLEEMARRRNLEHPFERIEAYPVETIAGVLKNESPAVAAVVLAHLEPATSSGILACYDPEVALDVVRRMTKLTPPGYATLRAIATDLEDQLGAAGEGGTSALADSTHRLQTIAEMLSRTGEDIERIVLQGLDAESAEVAQEIREHMFTWDDLASVDKRSMQKILGSVNTKTLSIALKACNKAVESNVLSNLSARVREMVAEERELAGPVPMSEVDGSREEIMQAVRALMDAGEFRPVRAGEDLVT